MLARSEEAVLRLNILVIGGGIAGLAAAFSLRDAGHSVRVLEKGGYEPIEGGLRVTPNFSKILTRWVGAENVAELTIRCHRTTLRNGASGDILGKIPWAEAVMKEAGGDYLLMHVHDCRQLLVGLATAAGVQIDRHTTVSEVRPGQDKKSPRPQVVLSTGEVLEADLVIGADGKRGLVRNVVYNKEDVPRPSGFALYVATSPIAPMIQDPELKPLVDNEQYMIFRGANRAVGCHFVRSKAMFALQIYSYGDHEKSPPEDHPDGVIPVNDLRVPLDDFAPKIQRLVKMVPSLQRIQDFECTEDSEDEWMDSTGRIVLLGEAAWRTLPGSLYGASMAVEDAAVLGTLLSHLHAWDQLPSLLYAYEKTRKTRRKAVRLAEIENSVSITLSDGAAVEARNQSLLSSAPDEWDESSLRIQFEKFVDIYGYDAMDAAEEWWVNWGRYNRAAPPLFLDMIETVTIEAQ